MKDSDYAFHVLKRELKDVVGSSKSFESETLEELGLNNDIKLERILRKILFTNFCVSCVQYKKHDENPFEKYDYDYVHRTTEQPRKTLFCLKRFSMVKYPNRCDHLFHRTDVDPDTIMSNGLSPRYSLSITKPFGPLIFLGKKPIWIGEFTYRIKIHQTVYVDTNLNWKCNDTHHALCVLHKIHPKDITVHS